MTTEATEAAQLPDGQMSLMDHLTELRTRIIKSVVAVTVGAVIAYIFYPPILDFLLEPHCRINAERGISDECGLLVTRSRGSRCASQCRPTPVSASPCR